MSRRKKRWKKPVWKKEPVIYSEHHLVPISQGGKGGKKIKVPDSEHKAWHRLVKNSMPGEAAFLLSKWIQHEYRFFAFNKDMTVSAILNEILIWKNGGSNETSLPKIIKFEPSYVKTNHSPNLNLILLES